MSDTMSRAITAAVVVLAIVSWPAVGPVRWGGALAAVTVRGSSMAPGVVAGDLVLVADRPPYRIGDVVAHRATPDGSLVLHRIVAVDGDHLVLQGDANDHVDEIRPRADEVVGRQVLHVPNGERLVRRGVPAVGAALGVIALAGRQRTDHRRRRQLVTPSV